MNGLKEYLVHYENTYGKFLFRCWAEDEEHAKEQCLNAEPGCTVVLVELR